MNSVAIWKSSHEISIFDRNYHSKVTFSAEILILAGFHLVVEIFHFQSGFFVEKFGIENFFRKILKIMKSVKKWTFQI